MASTVPNVRKLEEALLVNREELFRFGTAVLFVIVIMLFAVARGARGPNGILLVAAAMIGGYMALDIGTNDVATNVGPAVASQAITPTRAIAIAALFEAGGALIAGGDVVGTAPAPGGCFSRGRRQGVRTLSADRGRTPPSRRNRREVPRRSVRQPSLFALARKVLVDRDRRALAGSRRQDHGRRPGDDVTARENAFSAGLPGCLVGL
jgi:hypothetical protein